MESKHHILPSFRGVVHIWKAQRCASKLSRTHPVVCHSILSQSHQQAVNESGVPVSIKLLLLLLCYNKPLVAITLQCFHVFVLHRGTKKYQDCVIYYGNNLCPDIQFDLEILNTISNNMFNKYNWTCSDNSMFIFVKSTLELGGRACLTLTFVVTDCSPGIFSSVFETCSSIIESDVVPLIDKTSEELLALACK